jgi:hypothetical protein
VYVARENNVISSYSLYIQTKEAHVGAADAQIGGLRLLAGFVVVAKA